MKALDRIQQKLLGLTKKQVQIVIHPHKLQYNDESIIYRNTSTIH